MSFSIRFTRPRPRLRPTKPMVSAMKTTFDQGDNNDRDKYWKQIRDQKRERRVQGLNHVFYNINDVTGRELYELIVDKLEYPYRMCMENRKNRMYLVIYPESVVETQKYIRELDTIARAINESSLKYFVRQVFQDLQVGEVSGDIIIPLDIFTVDDD